METHNSIDLDAEVELAKQNVVGYPPNWPVFDKAGTCLNFMNNESARMTKHHCDPQWEPLVNLCWPPTLAGHSINLPCPDNGFLNHHEFVHRYCLSDGTWYINETFDDGRPFSNFYDCFLPIQYNLDEQVRKFTNAKTVLILKTLYDNRHIHLVLNVISTFLLICGLVLGFLQIKKTRVLSTRCKHILLIVAALTLMLNQVISTSTLVYYDVSYIIKCRISKTLVSFCNILFCACLLGVVFIYAWRILEYKLIMKRFYIALVSTIFISAFLVVLEVMLEVFVHRNIFCGFGTLQTTYHWVISFPKFISLACTFSVDIVVIYAAFVFKPKHLVKDKQVGAMRLSGVNLAIMAGLNVCSEALLVLLHNAAALDAPDYRIKYYAQTFYGVSCGRGIAFAFLMCFLDSDTQALMPCKSWSTISLLQPKSGRSDSVWSKPTAEQTNMESDNTIRLQSYTTTFADLPTSLGEEDKEDSDYEELASHHALPEAFKDMDEFVTVTEYSHVMEHQSSQEDNKPTLV